VETLNWMLKSQAYRVPLKQDFEDPTDASVRTFQRHKGLRTDGVVDEEVAGKLRQSLRKSPASWYGPGFFGNRTACGQKLHRDTVGVAHRNLPCGTKVVVGYEHHWVQTKVIDRGPYAKMQKYNVDWDLTQKTARRLGFEYNDKIRVGVIKK
jgi:rare lipoprotein A (peptidoglycan hydrolase)